MTFGLHAMARFICLRLRKEDCSCKDLKDVPKCLCDGMIAALLCGKKVRIERFGVIELKRIRERTRRNPKTGEVFEAEERMGLKFKPSKKMLKLLNTETVKSKKIKADCQIIQSKTVVK